MSEGKSYTQVSSPIFWFEEAFDLVYMRTFLNKNIIAFVLVGPLYVALVIALQYFMNNRNALQLRTPLIIWNWTFALLSFAVFSRVVPEFVYAISEFGYEFSICDASYLRNKVSGVWSILFGLSKLFELGDTFFIVLRKKKLIFLHIYHHFVVYIAGVFGMAYYDPGFGRYLATVNSGVHALMYFYFALQAHRIRISKKISMSLTILQILQLIVYFVALSSAFYYKYLGFDCELDWSFVVLCIFICITFILLFVNFFIISYLGLSLVRCVGFGFFSVSKQEKTE